LKEPSQPFFPLATATLPIPFLGMELLLLAALLLVVALPNLIWDPEVGQTQVAGSSFVNGLTIEIAELVGTLLFENGKDAAGQVGSTGTDSMMMMLAMVDHLVVIDSRQLHISEPADMSVEIEGGFDEIGTGFGQGEALGFAFTTLVGGRNDATPLTECGHRVKTVDSLDEGNVGGGTGQSNAGDTLQVTLRMQPTVERFNEFLAQSRSLL
jgi:hypothetical protein